MEENNAFLDWLGGTGFQIALILVAVYLFRKFGMLVITRAVRRSITEDDYASEIDEKRREDTLIGIIGAVVRVALYALAGMMILSELGVDIGPLIAGASVLGVALGFGAQSLVKDFVSGLFIILENQYRVGDVVEIAGVSGSVQEITIRTTVLRNLDGEEIHVPNGSIDTTKNMTMTYANIHLNIGVSYSTDMEKAQKIIDKVGQELAEDEEWQGDIEEAPSFLRVNDFGASEVTLKILGKVAPGAQWRVAGEFRKRLKAAFDKEGIEIPFPQMDIHQKK